MHLLRHILRALPLVLFLTYHVSTTQFAHVHYVDGRAVAHSHPFVPGTEHQHSAGAFLLIQQLSSFHSTAAAPRVALLVFAGFVWTLLSARLVRVYRNDHYPTLFCRPPPVA